MSAPVQHAEHWLFPEKIAELESVTPRAVRKRLGSWEAGLNGTRSLYIREVATRGGASGTRKKYDVAAIERDFPGLLKFILASPARPAAATEVTIAVTNDSLIERPAEQQPLFATVHHELTREEYAQAAERLAAIQPLLDFRSGGLLKGPRGGFRKLDDVAIWSANQFRTTSRTLYRWLARYDAGGFAALPDRARSDRGISKLFGALPAEIPDAPEAVAAAVSGLTAAGRNVLGMIRSRYSARECHEALCRDPKAHGLRRAPNYDSVRRFVAAIPSALRDAIEKPGKQWDSIHAPYVVRDYTSAKVNEWWVFDHAQDDFFCFNDFIPQLDRCAFPGHPQNAWLRMWITAIEDVRSRLMVGYAFCATPSSTSICSALRMAVLRTGRAPRFGLVDRGKDYLKVGKPQSGLRTPVESTGLPKPELDEASAGALFRLIRAQWGTQGAVVKAIGEHPQSKPVEPWFRLKRLRFDSKVSTWCSNRPDSRPDLVQPMLDAHARWTRGELPATPLPPASLAVAATAHWIEQGYNAAHRHSGHGMNRRTPLEIFRAAWPSEKEDVARAQLDPRSLEEFLRDRQTRKVFSGGCVQLYSAEYEPATPADAAVLRVWDTREVLVACDPHMLGDAVAYAAADYLQWKAGERLGAMVSKKLLAWGESQATIREKVRAARKYRRGVDLMLAALAPPASSSSAFGFLGSGFAPAPDPRPQAPALQATGTEAPRALRAPARKGLTSASESRPLACDVPEEMVDAFADLEPEDGH